MPMLGPDHELAARGLTRRREQLGAIISRAVRHGLVSQSRAQHPNFFELLRGRVSWVEQARPQHALKLRKLLAICEAARSPSISVGPHIELHAITHIESSGLI